jgi:ABC-type phosphate/phosphonate transport system substrate-binding protein
MSRSLLFGLLLTILAWPAGATPESVPLNMGFYLPAIRDANMADLKVSLGVWAEEIAKPYNIKIRTTSYEDMDSMRRALDRAEFNFINAPGMELAELFRPEELRQGYARRHHGMDEGLVLLVAKNSAIQRFADLRGKRVVRLSDDRLSKTFLETQCLKTADQDCREFFTLSEEKRDILSVYSVFFGRADAALVQISTLRIAEDLNPQVAQRLRVILDWKASALIFGMMTRQSEERHRTLILNSVREVLKTPRGRQLLELFKTDYLEPVDADALKPYRALLREYNELHKAKLARKP